MKKIDFKNKKVKILLVVLVAIIFIGGTYAYWRLTLTQTEQNELASACFDITISDEQNDINLQRAAPISDEEGMSLTPYTFTITNNCSTFASYSVNLELLNTILEANRLSAGFVKVMLDENTPTVLNTNTNVTPTLDNAYEAYELTTGYLDANASVTYNLRLWIDQDVTIEDDAMNKQLESKITITASYLDHMPSDYDRCVADYGADSPQCQILAELDTTGTCPTVNDDGTVNVTDIESENGYICSAPDDYGTSYYFRGNVTNNYVKFAGFYWRILRINGDGSIRMIYAGDADVIDALDNKTEVLANGYNDEDTGYTQIGTSAYNSPTNDNAYVGYMYGNRDGVAEGSTQYSTYSQNATGTRYYADSYSYNEETGQFTLNNPTSYTGAEVTSDFIGKYTGEFSSSTSGSQIYKVINVTPSDGSSSASIDCSYVTYGTTSKEKAQENINDSTIKEAVDNWYETNILDTEYAQYISDTLFCNDRSFASSNTGTGAGISETRYRWDSSIKTLKCSQQNDRFTVDDEVVGNGDLTYPIGLLTTDEVYLAGGSGGNNSGYYLYTGNYYWTMSPSGFNVSNAYVRLVSASGYATSHSGVNSSGGVRPVLNLKSGSLTQGSGTVLDPYLVG